MIKHSLAILFLFSTSVQLRAQTPPEKPEVEDSLPVGVDANTWRNAKTRIDNFTFDRAAFQVALFANSDQTQNPTAICFDDQNKLYLAENYRLKVGGVDDNRSRLFWFLDDVSNQTVADRLKMYKKWESKFPLEYYTKISERVITLEDRNNDGMAETRTVFADKFNDPLDGPAIGLIAKEGKVYLTCIPHLYLLEDTDGDGVSDKRQSLQDGFGVRVSLAGHDLHGLAWGPDGKLYWSMGDRGYNFTTKEGRHFKHPASGAVFRCDPDGTDVEVYHLGLRNPQELAFDQFGNLFTVDNNADIGDKARVVYLIEGGETGWNSGTQNLSTFREQSGISNRGNLIPWMTERIWVTQHDGRPAYALPPMPGFTINGHCIVSGPSGLVFHSTNVMGEKYANTFYVCDFRGRDHRSGIFSFKVENDGAGFKVTDHANLLTGIATTDIDFSYDGKMYIADWYGRWDVNTGGNVYTLQNNEGLKRPHVQETESLFRNGFHSQKIEKLASLLSHVDMRMRIRAQYELVKRGAEGRKVLLDAALNHDSLLARLHGIWGMGQLGRNDVTQVANLAKLLDDPHYEVRANTLKVLGEAGYTGASTKMIALLKDDNLRVRSFAAQSLGKIKSTDALEPLAQMLIENGDSDRFLRHSGFYAITQIPSKDFVYENLQHENKSVRLAMLLVLRRWKDPHIKTLLHDSERFIVEEAVRAIHDLPIAESEADVANILNTLTAQHTQLTHQRVVNSNYRLGKKSHAQALLRYAGAKLPMHNAAQIEAMHLLNVWDTQHTVDRVVGLVRPYPAGRDDIKDVVDAELPKLLTVASDTVAAKAIDLASKYDVTLDSKILVGVAVNGGLQNDFRLSAINSLLKNDPSLLLKQLPILINDEKPQIRASALQATLQIDRQAGLAYLRQFIDSNDAYNRQAAYKQLGNTQDKDLNAILVKRLGKLIAGEGMKESHLELVGACAVSEDPAVSAQYHAYQKESDKNVLAPFQIALYGGDKERGESLVKTHGTAQCIRCHRLDHRPSTGPGLRYVGKKQREYLLRALITPSSEIAEGFGVVTVITDDGKVHSGTVVTSDNDTVTLKVLVKTAEDKTAHTSTEPAKPPATKLVVIMKSEIDEQSEPKSAMVPMGPVLKKHEIRDVIEFLSTLTQ